MNKDATGVKRNRSHKKPLYANRFIIFVVVHYFVHRKAMGWSASRDDDSFAWVKMIPEAWAVYLNKSPIKNALLTSSTGFEKWEIRWLKQLSNLAKADIDQQMIMPRYHALGFVTSHNIWWGYIDWAKFAATACNRVKRAAARPKFSTEFANGF